MRLDPHRRGVEEGSGDKCEGRDRVNEFQLKDCMVSMQDGPVIEFRERKGMREWSPFCNLWSRYVDDGSIGGLEIVVIYLNERAYLRGITGITPTSFRIIVNK